MALDPSAPQAIVLSSADGVYCIPIEARWLFHLPKTSGLPQLAMANHQLTATSVS